MEISSKGNLKEKMVRQLGLDQPSGLDLVNRRDYADEDAFLDAATKAELERQSPEYQAVRRRLAAEYRAQQEQAQKKAADEQYKEIRAKVQLAAVDVREIDARATELAQRDLAAGRISASGLGEAIAKYAEQLTEKRKDTLASNAQFNNLIRQAARGSF